jgi:CP family cyanate transporter-like MFS transporter
LTPARLAIVAVFLAAIGARTQLILIGPLLPKMTPELGISHLVAGLLITMPVVLMSLVAIPGAGLGQRFGPRRVMAVSLALLTIGGVLRPLGNDALWILLWTVPVGIGIGVIGVILPVFVKQHAGEMPARVTGLYVTAMLVGSALGGLTAAPLAELGGSWRVPLMTFGALGVVPLVGWLILTEPDHSTGPSVARAPLPWRSQAAWLLVAAFSLQGIIFYGVITWLAPSLVERGYSALEAGAVVGVMLVFGIPGTLLVSWLGDRLPSRRLAMAVTSLETLIAVIGFAFAPQLALLWSVLGGLGLAGIFALVMILPLDAASRPTEVAAFSGVMLSVGYMVSAVAPALLGAARDATGNFTLTLLLLVVTAAVMLTVSLVLSPSRLRST